jgi:hypothetical protein
MLQFWQEKDKRRIMEQGQKQIRKKKDLGWINDVSLCSNTRCQIIVQWNVLQETKNASFL